MADICTLMASCPQAFNDKEGARQVFLMLAQALMSGSISNPQVTLGAETPVDVPDANEDIDGIEILAANTDRYTGWVQNISIYTVWVSHSPDPQENESTRLQPGDVYNLGTGWITGQPLYAKMYGNPGQVARLITVEGTLA